METKQKLAEWKGRRAEEEELAAERRRRDELLHARLGREQRRQQLQQRELVEMHRRRREEMQRGLEQEKQARASSSRRALSQEDRQRIARRSMEVLRRRLQAQGGPTPRAAERAPSPMSSRSHHPAFDHVESRLYDTTESYIQKIRGQPASEEDSMLLATQDTNWACRLRSATSDPPNSLRRER